MKDAATKPRSSALLNGGAGDGGDRRGVVSGEKPAPVAANEDVGGLDHGFVEALGEGGGNARGAGDPTDVALDADPERAESDADALGVLEYARPALADFVPTEKQLPTGLHTLDAIVVRPYSFHLRQIERLKGGVEALIRGANGLFFSGRLVLRSWRGHGGERIGSVRSWPSAPGPGAKSTGGIITEGASSTAAFRPCLRA